MIDRIDKAALKEQRTEADKLVVDMIKEAEISPFVWMELFAFYIATNLTDLNKGFADFVAHATTEDMSNMDDLMDRVDEIDEVVYNGKTKH